MDSLLDPGGDEDARSRSGVEEGKRDPDRQGFLEARRSIDLTSPRNLGARNRLIQYLHAIVQRHLHLRIHHPFVRRRQEISDVGLS